MTKQAKVRGTVVGLLLAVALGAPIASIVANAPHRATAQLGATETLRPTLYAVGTGDAVTETTTLPEVTIAASAPRRTKAAKAERAQADQACKVIHLEQQGIGYDSTVMACGI